MMRAAFVGIGICMMLVVPPSSQDGDEASCEPKCIIWANEPGVLAGITAVNLHVAIQGDALNAEVGETALREQTTSRLRAAGITVLADDQVGSAEVPVMLTVIVECKTIEQSGGSIPDSGVFLVTVQLDDVVALYRLRDTDAIVLGATTWARRSFGSSARCLLPKKSMDQAMKLIDAFCRDAAVADLHESGDRTGNGGSMR